MQPSQLQLTAVDTTVVNYGSLIAGPPVFSVFTGYPVWFLVFCHGCFCGHLDRTEVRFTIQLNEPTGLVFITVFLLQQLKVLFSCSFHFPPILSSIFSIILIFFNNTNYLRIHFYSFFFCFIFLIIHSIYTFYIKEINPLFMNHLLYILSWSNFRINAYAYTESK